MRLATNLVRIIPFEGDHWPYIYAWSNSGDYEEFFGNIPLLTSTDCASFNRSGKTFMIVNPQNLKQIYGMICLTNIEDRHRNLHFGILIDKSQQQLGICREAAQLMMYYIMNSMNFYKVIARIDAGNERSKKVTSEFGFSEEGILRQDAYFDGEFRDVIRYYITKGVFNKRYKEKLEKSSSSEKEKSV